MWVLIGHAGSFPVAQTVDRTNPIGWFAVALYHNLISGPAAVIVFFVVSGFCIHYPYAAGANFEIVPFLVRRYVRIGVPMAAAVVMTAHFGIDIGAFDVSILWSLVAELIYYTIYPALRWLIARLGMRPVIVAAYAAAVTVAATNPGAGNYPSYGTQFNWILGLPCWLLGLLLADRWATPSPLPQSNGSIWYWRLFVWGLSIACSVLRFHSPIGHPIGYPWTLNLFAIAVFLWIDREIARATTCRPWGWLESAGLFSYSLYLFHVMGMKIYNDWSPGLEAGPYILGKILFCILLSYGLYLLIERPSHSLARYLSRFRKQRIAGDSSAGSAH